MDLQDLTYDLCRCYVRDNQVRIPTDVYNLIFGWIRSRNIGKLADCPAQIPDAYNSLDLCRITRQVAAFFKKNEAFADDSVCDLAAEKAFFKAESLCRRTNRRVDFYSNHPQRIEGRLKADIDRCKAIIYDVLGDFDSYVETIPQAMRVTAGATATRGRRVALPYLKANLRCLPCSPLAMEPMRCVLTHFGYRSVKFQAVSENRVTTVPKNYKTNRTIACEPEGNLSLQLTLDAYLRARLKKLGVDLSKQSKNQEMSRMASLNDSHATIDLSMASDTLSINTVCELLPFKWWSYANRIRSKRGNGFGKRFVYAKFSSMGNGATFPLESLIFATICRAVCKNTKEFCVYGDDLIVPNYALSRLYALLRHFGFRLNEDKSYTAGLFRESCGTDWFNGVDVTPMYLRFKGPLSIEIPHIVNTFGTLCFPGSLLGVRLRNLFEEHKPPVVPFSESSNVGVWVTPSAAYELKLIRTKNQIPRVKGLVAHNPKILVRDSRTLFLWHLDANRRKRTEGGIPYWLQQLLSPVRNISFLYQRENDDQDAIIRSTVPTFSHKYKRKWLHWIPPMQATPVHLYWWTDFLLRREAKLES